MKNSRIFSLFCIAVLLLIGPTICAGQVDYINTVAGGGPNNVPAVLANVNYPGSTAWDSAGNLYVVSTGQERVFKITPSGTLTVVAGSGFQGYYGDGGLATEADLNLDYRSAIALDSSDNLYIADSNNCVVREVNASTGIINTIAGTPNYCSYGGDGGPATSAYLNYPVGLAIDSSGDLFINDVNNGLIREVTSGTINTVAGTYDTWCYGYNYAAPPYCGDGGPATSALLNDVTSIAVDGKGNVFVSDWYYWNQVVRLFTPGGNINTVAGTWDVGTCSQSSGPCGDGGPATSAEFYAWCCGGMGLASDSKGNLFIADTFNDDVREVFCADTAIACTAPAGKQNGYIYTVAGIGGSYGYGGDGGPATNAQFTYLYGTLGVDANDDILIGDYNNQLVREVYGTGANAGNVNTVAGNGSTTYSGNNIPATNAELNYPQGIATDTSGNFYIADTDNYVVRKVDSAGTITLFAGTPGQCGYSGDGGPATAAELCYPTSVALDGAGNVYIADWINYAIREVDTAGNISTVASGANGLYYPWGVAVSPNGSKIYVSEYYGQVVVEWNGSTLTTVAGNGTCGYNGDGTAIAHELCYPSGLALAPNGSLYIADQYNHRIRKLDTSGNLTTIAGNGDAGYTGDGYAAVDASLYYPLGVAIDPAGDILIADTDNVRIREVDGEGLIHTIAGDGCYYYYYCGAFNLGDGGLATNAALSYPYAVGVDPSGDVFVADTDDQRIREINALPGLNASTSEVTFDMQPVGSTSEPQQLTLTAGGPITFSGITMTAPFTERDDCSGITNGESCTVNLYFTPTQSGPVTGTATVASNSFFNSSLVINLSGVGVAVVVSPGALSFPTTAAGSTSKAEDVTVTNKGTGTLTFGAIVASTNFKTVTASSSACKSTLAAGASCNLAVEFAPTAAGLLTGTLAINDSDSSSPQFVDLSGTATNGFSVSPTIYTFKAQAVGSPSKTPEKITIKYTGTPANGKITSVMFTGTNGADFSVVAGGTCPSLASLPAAMPAASCTYAVSFKPSVDGSESATMTVNEMASGAPGVLQVSLSGTGTGTGVTVTPAKLAFGKEKEGSTTLPMNVTITYEGEGTLTLNSFAITGTKSTDFSVISGGSCPFSLPAAMSGSSCTYEVTFTPSTTAAETATLTISDTPPANGNAEVSQSVSLTGTGTK